MTAPDATAPGPAADGARPVVVRAPVPGRARPLADVPDPVFADEMVGPGAAVDPPRQVLDAVAPIDGTIVKIHPHAFVVQGDDGLAVLVHLGIDTVRLEGAHFTVRARPGGRVRAGDVVTTWDVAAIVARGLDPVVPVVALELSPGLVHPAVAVLDRAGLLAGDPLFTVDARTP